MFGRVFFKFELAQVQPSSYSSLLTVSSLVTPVDTTFLPRLRLTSVTPRARQLRVNIALNPCGRAV